MNNRGEDEKEPNRSSAYIILVNAYGRASVVAAVGSDDDLGHHRQDLKRRDERDEKERRER